MLHCPASQRNTQPVEVHFLVTGLRPLRLFPAFLLFIERLKSGKPRARASTRLHDFIKGLPMFPPSSSPNNGFGVWSLSSLIYRLCNQPKAQDPNYAKSSHSLERAELFAGGQGQLSDYFYSLLWTSCPHPGVRAYSKQFTLCLIIWAFFLEIRYP